MRSLVLLVFIISFSCAFSDPIFDSSLLDLDELSGNADYDLDFSQQAKLLSGSEDFDIAQQARFFNLSTDGIFNNSLLTLAGIFVVGVIFFGKP